MRLPVEERTVAVEDAAEQQHCEQRQRGAHVSSLEQRRDAQLAAPMMAASSRPGSSSLAANSARIRP
jgi:hypothetical protein